LSQEVRKTIVLGSGPAGYTAAIYLSRANIPPLVFAGNQPGGQLTITTDVENFPGFPEGIQGPELTEKFSAQAARFGSEIVQDTITAADLSQRPFKITVGGENHLAHSLIVATGSSARWLNLPGEKNFHGKGLSACATCDGFFFRDQDVAVVGGGDTAMEEAIYLTNFCRKVTVVHRRDELRASKIMGDRAQANPKIEFAWSRTIKELVGDEQGNLTGVKLDSTKGEAAIEVPVTGCFYALGHTPNTEFLGGQLEVDDNGYVITKPDSTATSVEGVFAAGDVQDHLWRQAITAAGTGCMAALEAERWLGEQGI